MSGQTRAVTFYLKKSASVDEVWECLESAGCELLYSTESESEKQIFGHLPVHADRTRLLEDIQGVEKIADDSLPAIDWEAQWAAHGADYRDGYVHIELLAYAPLGSQPHPATLRLKAGPGFGDLSHPTTRLVLKLMAHSVSGAHVVDIGSGSGVLSLAACAMGASRVEGIEIDAAAIAHARENSQLNGMEQQVAFFLPEEYRWPEEKAPCVILMNMIQSEQQPAWEALPMLHPHAVRAVTSGILAEGRAAYLRLTEAWGWQLEHEAAEDGWLAFAFRCRGA